MKRLFAIALLAFCTLPAFAEEIDGKKFKVKIVGSGGWKNPDTYIVTTWIYDKRMNWNADHIGTDKSTDYYQEITARKDMKIKVSVFNATDGTVDFVTDLTYADFMKAFNAPDGQFDTSKTTKPSEMCVIIFVKK